MAVAPGWALEPWVLVLALPPPRCDVEQVPSISWASVKKGQVLPKDTSSWEAEKKEK